MTGKKETFLTLNRQCIFFDVLLLLRGWINVAVDSVDSTALLGQKQGLAECIEIIVSVRVVDHIRGHEVHPRAGHS